MNELIQDLAQLKEQIKNGFDKDRYDEYKNLNKDFSQVQSLAFDGEDEHQ